MINVQLNRIKSKIYVITIIISLCVVPLIMIETVGEQNPPEITELLNSIDDFENGIPDQSEITNRLLNSEGAYPEDMDTGMFLSNSENEYSKEFDPWLSKAAIHAVATSTNLPFLEDGDMLALAGGYLYDNEVHLYRWNYETDQYDLVSEIGDGIFQSDVLSIAFADTDNNNLTELICGCEDGRLYVFEQKHLYDPYTNTENLFELVWMSPRLGRIFSVIADDTDKDYRTDIIVGTANTLRFYEYIHHSGYPFAEEHWIEYEEVFSYEFNSDITSLAVSDIMYNGLPEIAVGMKSGEIILLENNGTMLEVNGIPYPITQDNSYIPVWSSGNMIRRSISSMTGGNLDDDAIKEIVVAVQGQGAFILDTFGSDEPGVYRLEREFDDWESDPAGAYPLDNYVDWMISSSVNLSSSIENITNVYLPTGGTFYEPLNQSSQLIFSATIYPYNTAVAQSNNGLATYFNGTGHPAWAIFDLGNDEEGAGNGISSIYDLFIDYWSISGSPNVEVSVSANGNTFYPIIELLSGQFEVDSTLADASLNYYRYIKVNITGGTLAIENMEIKHINKPVYDALTTEVGSMIYSGDSSPTPTAFIGTMDGAILCVIWDDNDGRYKIVWDSWKDERWKLESNIFSMASVKKHGTFPAWMFSGHTLSYTGGSIIGASTQLPDGGELTSVAATNFYDFWYSKDIDYILSSDQGQLYYFEQDSPTSFLLYDEDISTELLGPINTYIAGTLTGNQYYTASLFPLTPQDIESTTGLFWLFLGVWNGTLGSMNYNEGTYPDVGEVDLYSFYLKYQIVEGVFYWKFDGVLPDERAEGPLTLSESDLTGQLYSVLRESTWMPKAASADIVGDSNPDIIVTNGKVSLLETVRVQNPPSEFGVYGIYSSQTHLNPPFAGALPFGDLDTVFVGDYFKEINENSKGRHYTNANPVDFDQDGDFDLILGFARYDEANFGFEKMSYGMTYWENEGSRDDPTWIEKKKAITNNVPESNFQVNYYTDPILIYDNYDFGEATTSLKGYHPLYQDNLPTRLVMFKCNKHPDYNDAFQGALIQFTAEYSQPTSLLVATYPEAKRIDINLIDKSSPTYTNFGFHIFETWNNEDELQEWTLSVDTADLDNDGKNELIVGDYNNNIYVFEHLTNDTYKRAWRSFDISREITTTDSPYAADQFGGISSEFTRTIFDHVKFLHAGCDLDKDNLQELIAATDDMVFIFEAQLTPSGLYVQDDTYQLVTTIDLQAEQKLEYLPLDQLKITALLTADDFTRNGLNELVIAAGSALLIYEIDADFKSLTEIFFPERVLVDSIGKYNLPGNYLLNPTYFINTILLDDLDKDGNCDLVLAGINDVTIDSLNNGFITIAEWQGGTFIQLADSEDFVNTVAYNPINDLDVDDSDLDSYKELVIGHNQGIDIYEFVGDNNVEIREVISSNPNYQLLDINYWSPSGSLPIRNDKDALLLQNGTMIMVYTSDTDLELARSQDNGVTWEYMRTIVDTSFTTYYNSSSEPTLGQAPNGDIWLVFNLRLELVSGPSAVHFVNLVAIKNFDNLMAFHLFTPSVGILPKQVFTFSPSIHNLPPGSAADIGLVYNYPHYLNGAEVRFGILDGNADDFIQYATYSYCNGSLPAKEDHYSIASLDATYIEGETLGLVFSGYLNRENRTLDFDLFYGEFTISSYHYNFSRPTRITTSGTSSFYPSILYCQDTDSLLVTYEEATLRSYGGLWSIWSNDHGISWNGPFDMCHPEGIIDPYYIDPVVISDTSFYLEFHYIEEESWTDYPLLEYVVRKPVLVPTIDGFTYLYSLYYDIDKTGSSQFYYIVSSLSPDCSFANYDLGAVSDLAVGDSDTDGRHEILAATSNRAVLLEFTHNTQTTITHKQVWNSPEYDRDLTAVTISDTNGNKFPELILESDRGIVNTYEVINKQFGIENMLYPVKEDVITISSEDGSSITNMYPLHMNNDSVEDLIYYTGHGRLIAVDGSDFSILWSQNQNDIGNDDFAELKLLSETTTNTPTIAATHYGNNVSLFNLYTGTLETSLIYHGERIIHFSLEDLIADNYDYEELVIGLENHTTITYSFNPELHKLSELWRYSTTDDDGHYIRYINIDTLANFTRNDVVICATNVSTSTGYSGEVIVLNGETGALLWNYTLLTYPYSSAIIDVDLDGINDVITGSSPTYALSGLDGSIIWNKTTGWNAYAKDPIITDLTNDGIEDIIIGQFNEKIGTIMAIDGKDGTSIWEYDSISTRTFQIMMSNLEIPGFGDLILGSSLLGVGLILNRQGICQGITTTTMDTTDLSVATSITTATLHYDRPVILLGDYNGNISVYTMYLGSREISSKMKSIEYKKTFDIPFNEDQISYLTYDVTGDSIDEVITVMSDAVLVDDMNERIVVVTTDSYGSFTGKALIDSIDESSWIIAVYESTILGISLETKSIEWDYPLNGEAGFINGEIFVKDLHNDGKSQIIFSRDYNSSCCQIGCLDQDGGEIWLHEYTNSVNCKLGIGNFDTGNGNALEIAIVRNSLSAPHTQYIWIGDADGKVITTQTNNLVMPALGWPYYPQTSHLAVGDFFSAINGDEFALVLDFASLNIYKGYDFSDRGFEVLFCGLNSGSIIQSNIDYTIYYKANSTEEIINSVTIDLDADGLDELILENVNGDLLGITTGQTVNIGATTYYKTLGALDNYNIHYSGSSIIQGNYSSEFSYIHIDYSTISCYSTLDLSVPPTVLWYSVFTSRIYYVVSGNFDKDLRPDLLVVLQNGENFIINSENFPYHASINQQEISPEKINVSKLSDYKLISIGFIILSLVCLIVPTIYQNFYKKKEK